MASGVFINGSWEYTNLSEEYKEAWSNFSEKKTQKCLQDNIGIFIKWSNRMKSTDSLLSLKDYRIRLQRLIIHQKETNRLTTLIPKLEAKLAELIGEKGQDKALLHLTQAVIRILLMDDNIVARKPSDNEAGIIVR